MALNPITINGLSPWEILGLHPNASAEEVGGAMKLLAKVVHPDLLPRGKALYQIVQAAADACKHGGRWPESESKAMPYPKHPFTPTPPPAPTPPKAASGQWRPTKKGGWCRKVGRESWINVYLAKDGSGWRFLGPDGDGNTYFDVETFLTAEDAMAGADEYFRGM